MKSIKNIFKIIRAFWWGKRLLSEYRECFRYFGVCYFSDVNQICITVAYYQKRFTIMHVEKIKTYKDFSIKAAAEFLSSCNDKWEVKL